MKRLCIDTGGTFTDCLVLDGSRVIRQFKASTTAAALEMGVLDAVAKAAEAYGQSVASFLAEVDLLVHGTTLATNTLLTGRGARTALITTKNFRDVIEIRRGIKSVTESIYNQVLPPYRPLVPRYLRRGVEERSLASGEVLTPLNESELRGIARQLGSQGVESLAVGFLHAYANPEHEREAARICHEELPDVYVSTSHEVLPVWREFERFSTTVVSAYIGPAVARYLANLEKRLNQEGFRGTLLMVTASGVVQSVAECLGQAVQLLGSGPAAAPAAAIHVGNSVDQQHLLSIDMGGTSFDVCLIRGGQIPTTTESWFGEERVAIKVVDVQSVGAGGGSIAWLDRLGMLRVGPKSAGSDPGPACYGRGNKEPTVTDANVVLGYVPSDYFLGGEMTLDKDSAMKAVGELGNRLGLGVTDAAHAILANVNATMADKIHEISTKRGHDVRDFALVAGGGAGPVHAAFLARALGIGRVIVPPTAGLYSAFGMLVMDLGRDYARSYISRLKLVDPAVVDKLYQEMAAEATEALKKMDVSLDQVVLTRTAEIRYTRQFHDVEVAVPNGAFSAETLAATVAAFHQRHEALYTFSMPWQDVELLTLRLRATVPPLSFQLSRIPGGTADPSAALKRRRACWFDGHEQETPVYDGDRLRGSNVIEGPAIIEERTTTVVIPPGFHCHVDSFKNYAIQAVVPSPR